MDRLREKGFTLIELLIVITVIGVLAVAVLSAINPIEQINKAEDARRRSDTAEILNALERYYASFNEYPWVTDGNPSPSTDCPVFVGNMPTGWTAGDTCDASNGTGDGEVDLNQLIAKNELKSQFVNRALGEYVITETGTQNIHVCFAPESQTWADKANFDLDGTTCSGSVCYVCVPE